MTSPARCIRLFATLAAVSLLAAACGARAPDPEAGPGTQPPEETAGEEPGAAAADQAPEPDDAVPEPDATPAPDQPGQPPADEPGSARTDGRAGDGGAAREPAAADGQRSPEPQPGAIDRGPVGGACRDYLRPDVPRLVVEVAHQEGVAPQPGAVDHLVGVLGEVVDKPGGVRLAGPAPVPGDGRVWTTEALRAFVAEHRTRWSSPDELAMHVLAVRGRFADEGVLGVALSATELVVFGERIGGLATDLLGGRGTIERAVLVHEAGHLLCLVNITYTSSIDHEDPENPNHSVHRSSVMHWAIPNDAVTQVFTGPPPTRFHRDDLADLERLRAGRY